MDTNTQQTNDLRPAAEAQQEAKTNFKRQVMGLIDQAVSSGVNRLEINVAAVLEGVVSDLVKELETAGYKTDISRRTAQGAYSVPVLQIKY